MSSQHKRPLCWVRRQNGEKLPAPRTPPPGSVKEKRLSGLLERVKDQDVRVQDTWRPIVDYEDYLRFLKINGSSDEHIEKIRNRHIKYYEKNPPNEPKQLPDYSIPFKVSVDDETVTTSSGVIQNPFKNFYDENNTVEDYVNMYTKAGCSDALIEMVRRRFEEKERGHEEASRHFDRVMSRYSGKSSTKAKKTSLRIRFARTMKSTAIKAEDLEDDMDAGDDE
jgi:hypothetical protein